MGYDREPRYLHPLIAKRLSSILDAINAQLPAGHEAKLISAYRSPADQLNLFKQGRTFRNGSWVKTGSVVTNLDGYIKLSRHNFLPCTAFDTGIFKDGNYLPESPLYMHIAKGKSFGMDWGGDWRKFKDRPHLEIPKSAFFKNNIYKDCGLIWQKYLLKAGAYSGAMDGIFGSGSERALLEVTGEATRSIRAWDILFDQFGVLDT